MRDSAFEKAPICNCLAQIFFIIFAWIATKEKNKQIKPKTTLEMEEMQVGYFHDGAQIYNTKTIAC